MRIALEAVCTWIITACMWIIAQCPTLPESGSTRPGPVPDFLAARLRQARQRVPNMRVVAADNMPGEGFIVDPDNAVIYYDALAPVDEQRFYLFAALGVLLADRADQHRYWTAVLGIVHGGSDGRSSMPRPRLRLVHDAAATVIPAQRQPVGTTEWVGS